MSEWITDRRPTVNDAHCGFVWITAKRGDVFREIWKDVRDEPWMPITPPEPYVKPKRWKVSINLGGTPIIIDTHTGAMWATVPTREAAERIAAIYEEVLP